MRITCPNCDTEYEVSNNAIPEKGRDVQCSNCGQSWFQEPVSQLAGKAPAPKPAGKSKPTPPPSPSPANQAPREPRRVDDDVIDILREEASHEVSAQEQDLENASQPDPELAAIEAQERGELPSGRQLSSSLRKGAQEDHAMVIKEMLAYERRKLGFRYMFSLVIIAAGFGFTAYSYAPEIIERYPEAEPYLTDYIAFVDPLRDQLDGGLATVVTTFNELWAKYL